jgi:hypothetical protein
MVQLYSIQLNGKPYELIVLHIVARAPELMKDDPTKRAKNKTTVNILGLKNFFQLIIYYYANELFKSSENFCLN